jgi:uncharacterized protein
LRLIVLSERLAVCRLKAASNIPPWRLPDPHSGHFYSLTCCADEISIVLPEEKIPAGVEREAGWVAIKVLGPLDFSLTGVLASLALPLADADISIFVISTFDTDYVLVRQSRQEQAIAVLVAAGHEFLPGTSSNCAGD